MARWKNKSITSDKNIYQHIVPTSDPVGEDEILKPVPQEQHPDDWPCFVLDDAAVYSKDRNSQGNILNAELDGPFTICGNLRLREEQAQFLIHDTYSSLIEITNVIGFSIADEPITIWASGRSGWFELKPSKSYQIIYDKMVEGVDLYYFLVDTYEEIKKKKKSSGVYRQLSVDWILSKYSRRGRLPISQPEAMKRFVDHATFLISQMRKERTHVNWTRTTIFQWLKEMCPDVHRRFNLISQDSTRAAGEKGAKDSPSTMAKSKSPHAPGKRVGSSVKANQATAERIFDTMKDLHEKKILCRQHMTISKLCKALYNHFEVRSEAVAEELLRHYAEPLLELLEENWPTCSIHRKIHEFLMQSRHRSEGVENMANAELILRNPQAAVSIPAMQATSALQTGQSPKQVNARKRRLEDTESNDIRHHGGQSTPLNSVDIPSVNDISSSSESETVLTVKASKSVSLASQSPRRYSRSGKGATLRLAQGSPIDEDSRPRSSGKRQKRLYSPTFQEEWDGLDIDDNNYSEYRDADYADEDAPEPKLEELELLTEELPSMVPQGPKGLWVCKRDGCEFEVPGADKPKGRAKIQAHFLEHADEIEARERLVIQEFRPHLPIDNLLEKIRNMGQAARMAKQQVIGGRVVPPPIQKRLAL